MNSGRRGQLRLNAYLRNSGYHESAWKVSDVDPAVVLDVEWYVRLALVAEEAAIEAIFLPDSPGEAEFRSEYLPRSFIDPVQLLTAVAMATEHVGLIATASTTYSSPWDLARRFATLDIITAAGRDGTSSQPLNRQRRPTSASCRIRPEKSAMRADEFVAV